MKEAQVHLEYPQYHYHDLKYKLSLLLNHQYLFYGRLILTSCTSFSCTYQCLHLVESKILCSLCGTIPCSILQEKGLHCEVVDVYLSMEFWEYLLEHRLLQDHRGGIHLNHGFHGFFHLDHQVPTISDLVLYRDTYCVLLGIQGLVV